MIPPWSIIAEENVGLVATCTRYDVAPAEGLQLNVGLVETPVAPFAGEVNVGAPSPVVKLQVGDQLLVPLELL